MLVSELAIADAIHGTVVGERLTSDYTTGGFCQSYSRGLGEMRILSVGVVVLSGWRAHVGLIAGWVLVARSLFDCYEVFPVV